jgi:hypothetical protein
LPQLIDGSAGPVVISICDEQPQLQPALLRLSATISQFFIWFRVIALMITPILFELRIRVRERQPTLDLHAQ